MNILTLCCIPVGDRYKSFRLWLLAQVNVTSAGNWNLIQGTNMIKLVHANDNTKFVDYVNRQLAFYRESYDIPDAINIADYSVISQD